MRNHSFEDLQRRSINIRGKLRKRSKNVELGMKNIPYIKFQVAGFQNKRKLRHRSVYCNGLGDLVVSCL